MKRVIFLLSVIGCALASMAVSPKITIPAPLQPGDRIAIITPSSAADSMQIVGAIRRIKDRGYEPVVMPHVFGSRFGSYAATPQQRADDLMKAFADTTVKAILCSRGGYGANQLLELIDPEIVAANPKWLVGYSDITILHAMMNRAGIASIHGPMAGHISKEPANDRATSLTFQLMQSGGAPMTYNFPPNAFNINGEATGRLLGGNLIVADNLGATPWQVLDAEDGDDVIFYIEDVGEKIYAIERILTRLHQSGALSRAKGLIVGRFSDYKPDSDFKSMEHMISYWLSQWGYQMPVAFDVPFGHRDAENFPILNAAKARLSVTPQGTTLVMGID